MGLRLFIIFYLPIIVLIERSGYMSFLGKGMWLLIPSNYINPSLGCFLGSHSSLCSLSPFTLSPFHHSSFLIHFDLGLEKKNKLL
jgi:hypothetical protein